MDYEIEIPAEDFELSADELDHKYNPAGNGEHPYFTRGEWVHEVFNHNTLLGYWEWIVHQLEQERP